MSKRPGGGFVVCVLSLALCACSSSPKPVLLGGGAGSGKGDGGLVQRFDGSGPGVVVDAGNTVPVSGSFTITPKDTVIDVVNGKAQTVDFKAKLGTVAASPVWSISRAEIGTIDPSTGHFVTGKVGGTAIVTADTGKYKVSTTITVIFIVSQNGAAATGSCAAGGCGGVGGEGTGPAPSAAAHKALDGTPTSNAMLKWLYPYDQTVWPLGLLAPLLQWDFDPSMPADAIKLELKSQYYSYTGYFGRPAKLAAAAPFVRHPIPQDIWDAATRSAARSVVKVKLTVFAGGKAYGAIQETWPIAGASLKGTVYYQSYGTNLAKNYTSDGPMGTPITFGGATLAISGSSTTPTLVAGDNSNCRVCHTVSADGSRMIVQHGDNYPSSSSYALNTAGYPETPYTQDGVMGWAGLSPDGTLALGNDGPLSGNANSVNSTLLDTTTGMTVASTGLTTFVTKAATPAFSPDGTQVAFAFYAGPGDATIGAGDKRKLVVMDFAVKTKTFSKPQLAFQATGSMMPGWPTFMPTGDRLVFQLETADTQNTGEYLATRNGHRGELWWADLKALKAYPLDRANGKLNGAVYLPTGANGHDVDNEQQFEPTVSPIVSGGYAWVVFTSRRMYGNVATIDPTWSDPRDHDLSQTPTPKKLWVAALDIPADTAELKTQGNDPSHPAFYLPAQELLAGNSRGFWVPEPCRADGKACDSGDQCCNGYCAADAKLKKNVCGGKPPTCAQEFDRCTKTADCCAGQTVGTLVCIAGRCAVPVPG